MQLQLQNLKEKVTNATAKKVGAAALGLIVLLKLKARLFGGGAGFDKEQAKYRKCNRCAKKGAGVRCTRCRRAYYCSIPCLKAAWKLEICECC